MYNDYCNYPGFPWLQHKTQVTEKLSSFVDSLNVLKTIMYISDRPLIFLTLKTPLQTAREELGSVKNHCL